MLGGGSRDSLPNERQRQVVDGMSDCPTARQNAMASEGAGRAQPVEWIDAYRGDRVTKKGPIVLQDTSLRRTSLRFSPAAEMHSSMPILMNWLSIQGNVIDIARRYVIDPTSVDHLIWLLNLSYD